MLKKGINYLFSAIFIIFAFCLFMNSSTYYQVAHFSMEKVLLFAVCIVAILFFFYRIAVKSGPVQHFLKYHRFSVLAIVMTVLLTIQIFFICTVYTPIGWDCSAVIMQAAKGNGFDSYFLRYPNNIFLCVIYRIWFFLVSALHFPANYWLWADVLNVFFIDAAIVLGVLVCDKIFSIKTYYFFFDYFYSSDRSFPIFDRCLFRYGGNALSNRSHLLLALMSGGRPQMEKNTTEFSDWILFAYRIFYQANCSDCIDRTGYFPFD